MKLKERLGIKCVYTGEIDKDGAICGIGTGVHPDYPDVRMEMTCLNGNVHGISRSLRKFKMT